MTKAFDTNTVIPASTALLLKQQGYTHVIRYIATGSKSVTSGEAHGIASAGLFLGLVYEAWGDTHNELSPALGVSHAQECLRKFPLIGAPVGAGIFFAVDDDQSNSDIQSQIVPYFKAIRGVLGYQYPIGVYGSGAVCAAVLNSGYADLAWLSNAPGWAGYTAFKASGRWSILQHLPRQMDGLDTDPDDINPDRPDIGAFIPFGALEGLHDPSQPPPPPAHDATWLQEQLTSAGFYKARIDGDVGPLTITAMIQYVESKELPGSAEPSKV